MPTQEERRNPQAAGNVPGNRSQAASDAARLARIAASEALATAAAIEDQKPRFKAQTAVREALAEAGLTGPGIAGVRIPEEPGQRVPSIIRAQVLVKAHQIEAAQLAATEALTEARAETDPMRRMLAIMEVVQVLSETGQTEAAENAAGEVVAASRAMYRYPLRLAATAKLLGSLGLAAPAQIVAGDAVQAANEHSADEFNRVRELAAVAEVLAQSGYYAPAQMAAAEALTVGRRIDNPRRRAWGIADAANALAETGQARQAEAAAAEAMAVARGVSGGYSRVQALTNAGRALARTGQAESALRAARAIDSQWQARALVQVIDALTRAGQVGPALEAARTIGDSRSRAEALTQVVDGLTRTGQAGLAVQVAGELDDLGARAQALTISARTLAEMGQSEAAQVAASEALAAAQAVGHWTQRSAVLTGMVSAFARIGQIGLAVQAARAIDLRSGMQSLVRAVELLALTGHDGPALAVARQLGDPEMQARVLAISAQALVGTGQMEAARAAATEAHAVAREIRDLDSRARILADAAGVLVETGQMEAARAAAGEAQTAAREIDSPEPRARILADAARFWSRQASPGRPKLRLLRPALWPAK